MMYKSKEKIQVGDFVRKLGQQRRQQALLHYLGVIGALLSVELLFNVLGTSGLGILFYVVGFVSAYYLYSNGNKLMRRATDAHNGAAAENEVAKELSLLERKQWQLEYNLKIQRWGDADVVLRSPCGHWYVIDVKSHKGTKVYENGRLKKRFGNKIYDFKEGDIIAKVKGQAAAVARKKGASWVTPLLCFTQSDIDIPGNQAKGVHIVTKNDLINTLLRLER
ncbi:NERD domain-containing protein [Nostoc sp. CENA67]|uniref:NERD domain-containing protein n=1 Tax=Amazonocrinis nigriterrae CENA67 TaxID=2794033 RepID=A0A8J7LAD2_9NOST|nr:nuclease-related domain-containing protein [Amazonocrinis nigriterrae]MBH8562461.1 NERD domain-containing protein [Amazonocrinis nigriterrae CENA67]